MMSNEEAACNGVCGTARTEEKHIQAVSVEILRGALEAKQHNASGDSDSDYSDGDERKLRWCVFAFAVV
jgi:hypothetical protein